MLSQRYHQDVSSLILGFNPCLVGTKARLHRTMPHGAHLRKSNNTTGGQIKDNNTNGNIAAMAMESEQTTNENYATTRPLFTTISEPKLLVPRRTIPPQNSNRFQYQYRNRTVPKQPKLAWGRTGDCGDDEVGGLQKKEIIQNDVVKKVENKATLCSVNKTKGVHFSSSTTDNSQAITTTKTPPRISLPQPMPGIQFYRSCTPQTSSPAAYSNDDKQKGDDVPQVISVDDNVLSSLDETTPPLIRRCNKYMISQTPRVPGQKLTLTTTLPSTTNDSIADGSTRANIVSVGKNQKKFVLVKKKRPTMNSRQNPISKPTRVVTGIKTGSSKLSVNAKQSSEHRIISSKSGDSPTKLNRTSADSDTKRPSQTVRFSTPVVCVTKRNNSQKSAAVTEGGDAGSKQKTVKIQTNLDGLPDLHEEGKEDPSKSVYSRVWVSKIDETEKKRSPSQNLTPRNTPPRKLPSPNTNTLALTSPAKRITTRQQSPFAAEKRSNSSSSIRSANATTMSTMISYPTATKNSLDSGNSGEQPCYANTTPIEKTYLDQVRAKLANTKGKIAIKPSHVDVVSHKTHSTDSVFQDSGLAKTRQQLCLAPVVVPAQTVFQSQSLYNSQSTASLDVKKKAGTNNKRNSFSNISKVSKGKTVTNNSASKLISKPNKPKTDAKTTNTKGGSNNNKSVYSNSSKKIKRCSSISRSKSVSRSKSKSRVRTRTRCRSRSKSKSSKPLLSQVRVIMDTYDSQLGRTARKVKRSASKSRTKSKSKRRLSRVSVDSDDIW